MSLNEVELHLFSKGGKWLSEVAQETELNVEPNSNRNYTRLGIIKYGLSLTAAVLPIILVPIPWSFPAAIVAFYLVESLFFFTFPLSIDNRPNPLINSIGMVLKSGYFRIFACTIGLAAFMLIGLLRLRRPTYNWSLGCIATLLMYRDELDRRK